MSQPILMICKVRDGMIYHLCDKHLKKMPDERFRAVGYEDGECQFCVKEAEAAT